MRFLNHKGSIFYLSVLALTASHNMYAEDRDPSAIADIQPAYLMNNANDNATPNGMSVRTVKTAYQLYQTELRGAGQVIGIVDAYDHPNIESDLAVFNEAMDLVGCTTANGCFKKVYANGKKPKMQDNWALQIALDVEWAHAIAPQAKIILVEAESNSWSALLKAVQVAVSNGANIVTMSWGSNEFANEVNFDNYFTNSGVAFLSAAGNLGAGVHYPAASPNVLGVGATHLTVDADGNYVSESAWSKTGGGLSVYENEPQYQVAFNIPNNPQAKRGVPDVAAIGDPNAGVAVYSSHKAGGWHVMGGTGLSTPVWAGFLALGNSGRISSLGMPHYVLYKLAQLSYNFNYKDITTGSNGSCGYFCTAQVGYDYLTGLGSPNNPNFINSIVSSLH